VANLYIPVVDNRARSGEASLRNLGPAAQERVTVALLDTFDLPAVSMIKIDVEGAEWGVIAGAVETIQRDRPLLLVEIEQRHHRSPASEVFARIAELGYQGYFLDASHRVRLISEFEFERYQNQSAVLSKPSAGQYINNFLFGQDRMWGNPGGRSVYRDGNSTDAASHSDAHLAVRDLRHASVQGWQ
jgi:hypothetical protein